MAEFIASYICTLLKNRHLWCFWTDTKPDAPNNFRDAHRPPQEGDDVSISYRDSDTMDSGGGLALEDVNGLFCGWIKREDIPKFGKEGPWSGRIQAYTREPFFWAKGGGTCYEGTVKVVITSQSSVH